MTEKILSSLHPTHLSGFGRGLDERDPVAAGELLRLPCVHCPSREVALVPHQHHGHVIGVLHPFDLFPVHEDKMSQSNTTLRL